MRKRVTITLVVIFVSYVLTGVAFAATISGKVFGGSDPMVGAQISLYSVATSLQVGSSVVSSVNGSFALTSVGNGNYKLYVVPPQGTLYRSAWIADPPFVVSGPDITRDIVLLDPTLTLSGTVKIPSGAGISNIRVCSSGGPTSKCVTSDAGGIYSMTGLDSGTYSLNISRYGVTNIPTPASFSIDSYISNLAISVNTSQDITVPLVTLSGKTTDSNGVGVANVGISLYTKYWNVGSASYSVYSQSYTSDTSGNYSVALLANNSYSANLTPVAGSGYVATAISSLDASITAVKNLKLNPAFTLSGTVKSPSGAGISNIRVCSSGGPTSKCVTSDAGGIYSMTGLDSGTYSLNISRYGVTNIPTPASFSIDSYISNLAISVNTSQDITVPLVTLSGKTTDSNGVGVANVGISLYTKYWNVGSASYSVYSQSYTSDTSGNYSVALLANNSYSITITPPSGSLFVPASLTGYDMTISKSQNIILNKSVTEFQLTLSMAGNGSGTINTKPVGLVCTGGTCSWYYDSGTSVTLTATPDFGSEFSGWSGGCTGSAACTISNTTTAIATFYSAPGKGICGSSNAGTYSTAPTSNLCSSGIATIVNGTGPWDWKCDGVNSGTTDTCNASKQVGITKPGDCNSDNAVTIAEVQSAINMFLGLKAAEACVDQDGAGGVTIAEVQKVINTFLGLDGSNTAASPTPITWVSKTSGTTNQLNAVTYGGGLFVAVGSSGTILTSSDGITWNTQSSGTQNELDGIIYASGQFLAVGSNGVVLKSSDGISWTKATSSTANQLTN